MFKPGLRFYIACFLFSTFCSSAYALLAGQISEIHLPASLEKRLKSFEPSAALYLADLDLFLIASDDTDKKDSPFLFLMDREGRIQNDPSVMEGVKEITDMESISAEGEFIYVLSSQGLNKKGKEKKERNLFVRAKRESVRIKDSETIELRPLLIQAIAGSKDPRLKALRSNLIELLDIEASFVKDGDLYIGLKDPQPEEGRAVLLRIENIDSLFSNRRIDQDKFHFQSEIDLQSIGLDGARLSDLIWLGEELYFAATYEDGGGAVGTFSLESGALSLLQTYEDETPEGLAVDLMRRELLIVFDQGDERALFSFERL